jgi:hypothetical protein
VVEANGPDAAEAIAALVELVDGGFEIGGQKQDTEKHSEQPRESDGED